MQGVVGLLKESGASSRSSWLLPTRQAQVAALPSAFADPSVSPAQPDDLAFKSGDIITIEEEVNADWWKGSLSASSAGVSARALADRSVELADGQTGLFPANVRSLFPVQ